MTERETVLWEVDRLVAAVGGRLEGAVGNRVGGISIDSRSIAPGDAFFAIRGDRFDGHDFVPAALDGEAALAVIAEERAEDFTGLKGARVIVPDVLEALENLGRAARQRMAGTVIGVTGSVGKTGTKEALRLALAPSGRVHAAERSFNNHWGVPLTLARMPADTEYGVFEIGMNHPGEIRHLVRLVLPHIAVITTVAPVHLGFFGSVEEIARAKAEIFEGVDPGGAVVLNADNPHFELLCSIAGTGTSIGRIVSFGRAARADVRLVEASIESGRSRVVADVFGERVRYVLGAPGNHFVDNSLAVLAAVRLAGADLATAADALAAMRAPRGRGERTCLAVGDGTALLIDESYNANPASMRAALDLLGASEPGDGGRRIAVLGDMLELGDASARYHADLASAVIDKGHASVIYEEDPDLSKEILAELWARGTKKRP